MNFSEKQQNHLVNLLKDVLVICRCKSTVSINKWHNLKLDIERVVSGICPDDENVVIYKEEKVLIKKYSKDTECLMNENEVLKQKLHLLKIENLQLISENKKLDQFERGVASLLRQKHKKH